eukprot:403366721
MIVFLIVQLNEVFVQLNECKYNKLVAKQLVFEAVKKLQQDFQTETIFRQKQSGRRVDLNQNRQSELRQTPQKKLIIRDDIEEEKMPNNNSQNLQTEELSPQQFQNISRLSPAMSNGSITSEFSYEQQQSKHQNHRKSQNRVKLENDLQQSPVRATSQEDEITSPIGISLLQIKRTIQRVKKESQEDSRRNQTVASTGEQNYEDQQLDIIPQSIQSCDQGPSPYLMSSSHIPNIQDQRLQQQWQISQFNVQQQ